MISLFKKKKREKEKREKKEEGEEKQQPHSDETRPSQRLQAEESVSRVGSVVRMWS